MTNAHLASLHRECCKIQGTIDLFKRLRSMERNEDKKAEYDEEIEEMNAKYLLLLTEINSTKVKKIKI